MKHIKLFEDYSDEELRDLQDTLHGIGHRSKFVFGEDFGIGDEFKTSIKGNEWPYISPEFFDLLLKRGEILKDGSIFKFKNDKNFGIPDEFESFIYIYDNGPYVCIEIEPKQGNDHLRPMGIGWAPIFKKVIEKLGEVRI